VTVGGRGRPLEGSAGGLGLHTVQLKVGGMSCSFCSESIRKAVGRQRGVEEVHVSLAHEEALVRFRPDRVEISDLRETLRTLGFTVRDPRKVREFDEERAAMEREKKKLTIAAVVSGVQIAAMLAMRFDLWTGRVWHAWAAFALATFVLFGPGRSIVHWAWGAARRGIANQHVLLTAGALGGYLGGILGTPVPTLGWGGLEGFPPLDFFGVVVFLTTYHLLSGYVSLRVRTRASDAVRRLMDLQPPTARVVREGHEEEVAIGEVAADDLVRVRPGEKVPVDGEVVEGRSAVDEALITGEAMPAEKAPGDPVIGGSVNRNGTLLVRVTQVGEEAFLHQVARHVEEAKALKPGVVVLVDRVLRFYVPGVLLVALGAFLFWSAGWGVLADGPLFLRGLYAGVSVLIMGYPCALGMATPLALIRGGGRAAERGILMRSGEAFQVLPRIEVVALDKTGTLTRGAPRVVDLIAFDAPDEEALLRYAAAAERSSEHPLGRAVVAEARAKGVELPPAEEFEAISGGGVRARVEGRRILVGRSGVLREHGVEVEAGEDVVAREEEKGRTVVRVAVEDRLAGVISIADTVKDDARRTVTELAELGIRPAMLTGDADRTARAVASEVGIEEVRSRVLPHEKAARVRELQAEGGRVAFVGDGINDAPALMQADVGIAVGAGTDIAIASSDVILVGERLGAIVDAYHVGHASYRKTVQNLWLAFFFNGVGVPLAATGILHPVWAMVAMAASVSAVLLNSFGGRLIPVPTPG